MNQVVERAPQALLFKKRKIPRGVSLMNPALQQEQITQFRQHAANLGRLEAPIHQGPAAASLSLAQWQTPITSQGDRATCWAFAGAAALEAAYHRLLGHPIKVSEEYVYHVGRIGRVEPEQRTEYPCSLWDGQGCSNVVMMMQHDAICGADMARPYARTGAALRAITSALGVGSDVMSISPREADLFEFSDLHIPLLARVNARYRVQEWAAIEPSVAQVKAVLYAGHEVVCDYDIGHTLLVIGFDDARGVFIAKNSWGGTTFTAISYANDPNFGKMTGAAYIKSVADPTPIQNHACWLGRWHLQINGVPFELFLRRHSPFPIYAGQSLGQAWSRLGDHAVTGSFTDGGMTATLNVELSVEIPPSSPLEPARRGGTTVLTLHLDHADPYVVTGQASGAFNGPITMSRFEQRYAALWEPADGSAWRSFHGTDVAAYQGLFDGQAADGYRLTGIQGSARGTGAEMASVWRGRDGSGWWANHGQSSDDYQRSFDQHVAQGRRLLSVTGYAERGQARFASIWTETDGRGWRARHGMDGAEFQAAFDQYGAEGYVVRQVSGYRVGIQRRFVALWEYAPGESVLVRHGLTSDEFKVQNRIQSLQQMQLAWLSIWPDSGRPRVAAVWSPLAPAGRASIGLSAAQYQTLFAQMAQGGHQVRSVLSYEYGV